MSLSRPSNPCLNQVTQKPFLLTSAEIENDFVNQLLLGDLLVKVKLSLYTAWFLFLPRNPGL